MENNYIIKEINTNLLEINPNNARFFDNEFVGNEVEAINAMLSLNDSKISILADDINSNGLNLHEMIIVKPIEGREKYLVMDGNRRVTSVKLITEFRERLKDFKLNQKEIRDLSNMDYNNTTVRCLVTEDDALIDRLLERTHTAKKGISRVNWDAHAKDNFDKKNGKIANRKIVQDMILSSEYCSDSTKQIIRETGWISKFARFIDNKSILKTYFGVSINQDGLLLLHWYEEITVKKLCKLIEDAKIRPAAGFVQNNEDIYKYLNEIKPLFLLDVKKLNDPLIAYSTDRGTFYVTDYSNDYSQFMNEKIRPEVLDYTDRSNPKQNTFGEGLEEPAEMNLNTYANETEKQATQPPIYRGNGPTNAANTSETIEGAPFGPSRKKVQQKLIAYDSYINISHQRISDLYEELKQLPLDNYINVASTGLRSLIEFTINVYADKFSLISSRTNKRESKMSILVSVYDRFVQIRGKDIIRKKMPAVARDVEAYKIGAQGVNHITTLNIMMHNQDYHTASGELKQIYRNMHPFLEMAWEDINK